MIFLNAHTHLATNPKTEILQLGLNEPKFGYYSIGVHPWDAESYDEISAQVIMVNCGSSSCLAIGEIGLDSLKGPSMALQIEVFRKQIEISEEYNLPVIIHCVKAWNELREIKKALNPKQKWIYHGFAQSKIVSEVVKENIVISIGARILNHPKNEKILSSIPDNQLLLETDDETIDIKDIYKCLAELKKISLQELAIIIEQNFQKTFPKWQNGLNEQN